MEQQKKKRHLSPSQIIIAGFLALIAVGCILLMLPVSTQTEGGASFTDALFTSVSAVCVTGLVVQNTVTYWSSFGQAVILVLIQIGGMGVVTVSVFLAAIAGRRIGLMQRSTMQEAISAPQMGGIVKLTSFIVKGVLIIELLGAILLAPVFCADFGIGRGIWYAVFHSVSAFCNAGFDLLGNDVAFSSLTAYVSHPAVNTTVMLLILVGGIGFLTWNDIRTHRFHLRKYRLQSKVALTMCGILILFPALYFFFFEFSGPQWNDLNLGRKILASLFAAVSPRTAGFNTVDLTALHETGQVMTMILMLIGGSPGSTAGGMKTTTIAVLFCAAVSVFRRRNDAQMFGRRVDSSTLKQASTLLLMYLTLFLSGGLAISCLEGLPVLSCLFESASAVGTVGLSLGITPQLGVASRLILMALMFLGRVGGLTLVFAAFSDVQNVSKLPVEKITVG